MEELVQLGRFRNVSTTNWSILGNLMSVGGGITPQAEKGSTEGILRFRTGSETGPDRLTLPRLKGYFDQQHTEVNHLDSFPARLQSQVLAPRPLPSFVFYHVEPTNLHNRQRSSLLITVPLSCLPGKITHTRAPQTAQRLGP